MVEKAKRVDVDHIKIINPDPLLTKMINMILNEIWILDLLFHDDLRANAVSIYDAVNESMSCNKDCNCRIITHI